MDCEMVLWLVVGLLLPLPIVTNSIIYEDASPIISHAIDRLIDQLQSVRAMHSRREAVVLSDYRIYANTGVKEQPPRRPRDFDMDRVIHQRGPILQPRHTPPRYTTPVPFISRMADTLANRWHRGRARDITDSVFTSPSPPPPPRHAQIITSPTEHWLSPSANPSSSSVNRGHILSSLTVTIIISSLAGVTIVFFALLGAMIACCPTRRPMVKLTSGTPPPPRPCIDHCHNNHIMSTSSASSSPRPQRPPRRVDLRKAGVDNHRVSNISLAPPPVNRHDVDVETGFDNMVMTNDEGMCDGAAPEGRVDYIFGERAATLFPHLRGRHPNNWSLHHVPPIVPRLDRSTSSWHCDRDMELTIKRPLNVIVDSDRGGARRLSTFHDDSSNEGGAPKRTIMF